uniref:Secreted protein n=1 Tax=Glossina austeni TaxID=7395 RepID=A0A1A9ULS2_GLOAU
MALNVFTISLILVKFCMSSSRAGAQDLPIICMTKSAYDLKSKTPFSACCLITASSSTSLICCKVPSSFKVNTFGGLPLVLGKMKRVSLSELSLSVRQRKPAEACGDVSKRSSVPFALALFASVVTV